MLYLEKGRSVDGWSAFGEGSIALEYQNPLSSALPAHLRFSVKSNSAALSGFVNRGFYGIDVKIQGYNASFFYKPLAKASISGDKLIVGLRDSAGQVTYGSSMIDVSSAPVGVWSKFALSIVAAQGAPSSNNYFFIQFPKGSSGDFDFNLISCFPLTYKNRINGARIDIAQAFADLKPGFIRLPGGNDLEGRSISSRFIWNNTIGPLENRPGRKGTWTGYNTEGFGLIEMMTFAEDIGATPILGVYAGYSLDGQSIPENRLQPFIDQVIDEIDFLTAPAIGNRMGALRARLGRQQPFSIKYVEIGNEDWFPTAVFTYGYRWKAFYNALSQRFPQIIFIATTAEGISAPPVVDDHHYSVPQYFIANFRRYENVPRPGPKILIGEFSVVNDVDAMAWHSTNRGILERYPTVKSAVAESIYRLGFERNSDIVIGGCYAPVLQNINESQWTPNLILFNANTVVPSTSYLVQKMFGNNLGNHLLNSTASKKSSTHWMVRKGEEGDGKLGNLYFVATKDTNSNVLIVKLANVDRNEITINATIQGSSTTTTATAYTLSAGQGVDPSTVFNTIENPNAVSIVTTPVTVTQATWNVTIPSWGVVVVTIPL